MSSKKKISSPVRDAEDEELEHFLIASAPTPMMMMMLQQQNNNNNNGNNNDDDDDESSTNNNFNRKNLTRNGNDDDDSNFGNGKNSPLSASSFNSPSSSSPIDTLQHKTSSSFRNALNQRRRQRKQHRGIILYKSAVAANTSSALAGKGISGSSSNNKQNSKSSNSIWANSALNVVEDDQPLATLKMSGNMTLLISKLRMLLTLFLPEAENVFCQFQPSENAAQLVLALEYFIFLQDTLLSPIERLEVIHRALPSSFTSESDGNGNISNSNGESANRNNNNIGGNAQSLGVAGTNTRASAALLARACKRCALEVANTESAVEELRKLGELFCIRKILTPALDARCILDDPQIAPQKLRMEAEQRSSFLSAIWRDEEEERRLEEERQRIVRENEEKEIRLKQQQEEKLRRRKEMIERGETDVSSNRSSVDEHEDDDEDDDAEKQNDDLQALIVSTGRSKQHQTKKRKNSSGIENDDQGDDEEDDDADMDKLAETLLRTAFGAIPAEKEEKEIVKELIKKRDERIIARINQYPALVTKFSDICHQRAADALRAASGADVPMGSSSSSHSAFFGAGNTANKSGVETLLGESGAVVGGGAAGMTAGRYERTSSEKMMQKEQMLLEREKQQEQFNNNNAKKFLASNDSARIASAATTGVRGPLYINTNNYRPDNIKNNNLPMAKAPYQASASLFATLSNTPFSGGFSGFRKSNATNSTGSTSNNINNASSGGAGGLKGKNGSASFSGGDGNNISGVGSSVGGGDHISRPYSSMPLSMLNCPKMSLLNFIHAWLTLDTDCSAVLPEKQVLHLMHLLGIYATLSHVRELVASISGSFVPILMYDIATALVLYEEMSNIYSLPIFVPAINIGATMGANNKPINIFTNNNHNNNTAMANANGNEENNVNNNSSNDELVHEYSDLKKFFKELQFESKSRINQLFSIMGHAHDAEMEIFYQDSSSSSENEGENDGEIPPSATAKTSSFNIKNTNESTPENQNKKQQKQQQKPQIQDAQKQVKVRYETMTFYLPRQLQLCLRDNRINSWFSHESQEIDHQSMKEMTLADFFICSSHKTYLAGPQFGASRSVSPEMLAHCLLREACRCIEIDCWEGRRHEPIVTNGGMTAASCLLSDILMVVQRCAFARTTYPLIIVLGVHGGFEFQRNLAQMLVDFFGHHILRAAKIEKYIERGKPITLESLKGKIILVANVSMTAFVRSQKQSRKQKQQQQQQAAASSQPTLQQQYDVHRRKGQEGKENAAIAALFDGTKACEGSLLRLLAAHRVDSHSTWRDSRENTSALNIWNDVEDPSHSTGADLVLKRRGVKSYSTQRYIAQGVVWDAPRRGFEIIRKAKRAKEEKRAERRKQKQQNGASPSSTSNSNPQSSGKRSPSSSSKAAKDSTSSFSSLHTALNKEILGDSSSCSSSSESEIDSDEEFNSLDPLFSNGAENTLHRITPNTARIDSSNLEPLRYWLSGTNMTALNFQVTNDAGVRMNRDLFLSTNGGIGFIPKPFILWRRNKSSVFGDQSNNNNNNNNNNVNPAFAIMKQYRPPALPKCNLRIEILAASMLPPPMEASFSAGSGFSVLIQLLVHETKIPLASKNNNNNNQSDPATSALSSLLLPRTAPPSVVTHRYRTQLIQDNLHSPAWDDELFELDLDHPNAAILTIQALACRHQDDLATPMLVGERSIFVHQLQQGVRMVPLIGQDGMRIDHPNSGVLCRFSLVPETDLIQSYFASPQNQNQNGNGSNNNNNLTPGSVKNVSFGGFFIDSGPATNGVNANNPSLSFVKKYNAAQLQQQKNPSNSNNTANEGSWNNFDSSFSKNNGGAVAGEDSMIGPLNSSTTTAMPASPSKSKSNNGDLVMEHSQIDL